MNLKNSIAVVLCLVAGIMALWAWNRGQSPGSVPAPEELQEVLFADEAGFDRAPQPEVGPDRAYERARHEDPDAVMRLLAVSPGSTVADIGAGTGVFSRRLARAVGADGRVLATELDPMLLATLMARAATDPETGPLNNISPRWVGYDHVGLSPASVDVAFLAHLDFYAAPDLEAGPAAFLKTVFDAVRPGGRLAVLQWLYWNVGMPDANIDSLSRQEVLDATLANWRAAGFADPVIHAVPMPPDAVARDMDPRVTLEMAFDTVLIVFARP